MENGCSSENWGSTPPTVALISLSVFFFFLSEYHGQPVEKSPLAGVAVVEE